MKTVDAKKTEYKITALTILLSLALSVMICVISIHFVFKSYLLLTFNSSLPIAIVLGTVCFYLAFEIILKNRLMKRFFSEDDYNNYLNNSSEILKKVYSVKSLKPVGVFFLILAILCAMGFSLNGSVGVSKDNVRFADSHKLAVVTKDYSEITLFKLEGYDDNGAYSSYGDTKAYCIVTNDGKYSYNFESVNDETENAIFKYFGNRYKTAKTIDKAINIMKSDG